VGQKTTSCGVKPINPQAIFFDFDGVIVESIDIKVQAFQDLYSEHGQDIVRKVVAHHKAHEGISRVIKIKKCHRELLGIDLNEADHLTLCQEYATIVEEKVVHCDGVAGAVEFLKTHDGRDRFFVASGTPEDELRRITARRDLDRFFSGVYGSPKTKDVIVTEILNRFGYDATQCLFIGDAMTDHDAALATNVPFIGRVGEGRHNPFPEGTRIIRDMTELNAS